MKSRLSLVLVLLTVGLGLASWQIATPVVVGNQAVLPAPLAAAATMSLGLDDSKAAFSYVGSKACKMCHLAAHKSWAKTEMGQALESLKPGKAKEIKEKFNLDPNKDYSTDVTCIKCHVTGFGEPGGYVIPDPKDKKAVRKAKKLAGVGCESCHGPGSEYVKLHKEIMKSKRKYKLEEMYAAGMQKIGKETCIACHNEEGPTVQPGVAFDYEKKKDEGIHEHKPLKQRE